MTVTLCRYIRGNMPQAFLAALEHQNYSSLSFSHCQHHLHTSSIRDFNTGPFVHNHSEGFAINQADFKINLKNQSYYPVWTSTAHAI